MFLMITSIFNIQTTKNYYFLFKIEFMKTEKKQVKKVQKPNEKPLFQSQSTLIPSTKSKKSLTILDTSQILNSKLNVKMTSPKQFNLQKSVLSPKNKLEINTINNGKSQVKANLIFKKTNLEQRGSLLKKQKPQSSTICIDKNKNMKSFTSQSLVSQHEQQSNNQQNGNINVDLQTSIWKQSEEEQRQNISNFIQSQCIISQLRESSKKKEEEIQNLKKQNQQLHKKLQKIKVNQQENRKMLKNRINSFNQEGQQLKAYKNKICQLEEEIQMLKENKNHPNKIQRNPFTFQSKLYQIKIQSLNLSNLHNDRKLSQSTKNQQVQSNKQMVDQNIMTCSDDSFSQGVLSFLNNQSSHSFSQQSRKEENQSFLNLQLDKIKIKYQEKYSQKVQNLRIIYQESLGDIEKRYNLLIQENKEITREQANQIFTLQKQLDSLYQKMQSAEDGAICKQTPAINILDQNQEKLKYRIEINNYKRKLEQKRQQLKLANQASQLHQVQCKRIQAELDIQRMKANVNLQKNLNKIQILKVQQSEQLELIKQELRRQKSKNTKLRTGCQQKQQIIKKLATLNHKKYVGRK